LVPTATAAAVDRVVTGRAADVVVETAAQNHIVAGPAIECVGPGAADERVVAIVAIEGKAASIARDQVVVVLGSLDLLDVGQRIGVAETVERGARADYACRLAGHAAEVGGYGDARKIDDDAARAGIGPGAVGLASIVDRIVAGAAIKAVVAGATVEGVVAGAPDQGVIAGGRKDKPIGVAEGDIVVRIPGDDPLDAVQGIDVAKAVDGVACRDGCHRLPGRRLQGAADRQGAGRQVDDDALDPRLVLVVLLLAVVDGVEAAAAVEGVVAGIAGKVVVVAAAVERVGLIAADDDLDAREHIVADGGTAVDGAAACARLVDGDGLGRIVVFEVVVLALAVAGVDDDVVAGAGVEEITLAVAAVAADEGVIAVAPQHVAVAGADIDIVVASSSIDEHVRTGHADRGHDDVVVEVGAADTVDVHQGIGIAEAVERLTSGEGIRGLAGSDATQAAEHLARQVDDHTASSADAVVIDLANFASIVDDVVRRRRADQRVVALIAGQLIAVVRSIGIART